MLLYLGSFSYTPHAVLCGRFLLHATCYFMCGVSLTRFMIFYGSSFCYMADAVLCGEFFLHVPCCFMWRVSLACPRPMLFYMGSFADVSHCYFLWEVSVTCPMLFCVGGGGGGGGGVLLCTPYYFMWVFHIHTPHIILCGEFLIHAPCCFMWGISYTPHAVLCGEFLTLPMLFYVGSFLHSQCCFMWGVSYTPNAVLCGMFFTFPMLFYVGSFLHSPCCFIWGVSHFSGRFVIRLTNQRKNKVCQAKSAYRASDEASVMPV